MFNILCMWVYVIYRERKNMQLCNCDKLFANLFFVQTRKRENITEKMLQTGTNCWFHFSQEKKRTHSMLTKRVKNTRFILKKIFSLMSSHIHMFKMEKTMVLLHCKYLSFHQREFIHFIQDFIVYIRLWN